MNKLIITSDDYKSHVAKICRDISIGSWRPDYIVGITRGGCLPAVMISQYFNVPCEMLKVSLREHIDTETNCWMSEDAFGYEKPRKNMLIVDDINDTGATINWIINDWKSSCFPANEDWETVWNNNVKFAVIVDNKSTGNRNANMCNVQMDFAGLIVNKSRDDIWIEFPYENWWAK
jgi:hypoxanthine phosphoribosyltransferase